MARLANGDVAGRQVEQQFCPAIAARVEGGSGTQISSQISTWKVNGTEPVERKRRSAPKGASWPATVSVPPRSPTPGAKCRRS